MIVLTTKRCPQCSRTYYDETLNFCLEDGVSLEPDVATGEERTVVMSGELARGETPTVHQLDPSTVDATNLRTGRESATTHNTSKLIWVVIPIAVLLAGFLVYKYFPSTNEKQIDSIAVLPLVNMSNDPEMEYLGEGIADNIADSLSQIPGLRVVPLSKVTRYKNADVDPQEVGNELGVRSVLVGRVTQRADGLSIRVELVDVAKVSRLWGEQYNRKLSDILAVQEEIAREISEALRVQLSGDAEKRLTRRYTENTRAYQLYLQGRYFWNRRTDQNLRKAVELFQQAIDEDPNYALAYAGLADSYALLGGPVYGAESSNEMVAKAKSAAHKALEIDSTLAEAYTSLGYIASTYEWDYASAERNFKRALELNPNYATARHWYGVTCLSYMGRHQEAIAETRRAAELDPLSMIINSSYGRAYYYGKEYDKAIEQFRKTIELDPSFSRAHLYLGWAYVAKGMFDEAVVEYEKARSLDNSPVITASLAHAMALSGKRAGAEKLLDELETLSQSKYVSPYDLALVHIGLGDKDRAFQLLEKAYQERSSALSWLKVDARLDPLRSDARFQDLIRRVGLPQ